MSFWTDRLTAAQAEYTAVASAIAALDAGGVQSYTLDTGQTRQTVTKLNLTELRKRLQALLNEISVLEVRCGSSGTSYGRPAG